MIFAREVCECFIMRKLAGKCALINNKPRVKNHSKFALLHIHLHPGSIFAVLSSVAYETKAFVADLLHPVVHLHQNSPSCHSTTNPMRVA